MNTYKSKENRKADLSLTPYIYKKITKMNLIHKCKAENYLQNNGVYKKYFNFIFSLGLLGFAYPNVITI